MKSNRKVDSPLNPDCRGLNPTKLHNFAHSQALQGARFQFGEVPKTNKTREIQDDATKLMSFKDLPINANHIPDAALKIEQTLVYAAVSPFGLWIALQ
jgi:hypothetical protein